jgi:general secretion pathway protein N
LKWWRRIGWVVLCVVIVGGALVAFMPARLGLLLAGRSLRGLVLKDVDGTVWSGRAGQVLASDGRLLGSLEWQLERSALWGDLHLDAHLNGPVGRFDGHLDRSGRDVTTWRDIDLRMDAAALTQAIALRDTRPAGVVEGRIERLQLQGNWPVDLKAALRWRAATVDTAQGHVVLGELHLDAESHDGVLRASVADDGQGPLDVDARLAASPLGWRLDGRLSPRVRDRALADFIARFGQPGRDGSVNLYRKAGLAPAEAP